MPVFRLPDTQDREEAAARVGQLQDAVDGWDGLTAAQKDAVVRAGLRLLVRLLRLLLKPDGTPLPD